ncbi:eukaryotic translation initiation factor 4E [Atractiella rhizophila]|nr:eukaryotic translation initiation factor 4E [Atractiella rhizophila]
MSSAQPQTSLPPAPFAAARDAIRLSLPSPASNAASLDTITETPPDTPSTLVDRPTLDFGAVKTVFEDASNFTHKHPLYSRWTLFFDNASKADKAKDWNESLQRVIDFDSVEEFWGLYNNIVPPTHMPTNSNYYLFKNGIHPSWEDDQNSNGGKWSVQLPKEKNKEGIDRFWLYTMLAAIGEIFETPYNPPASPKPSAGSPSSPSSPPLSFTDQVTGAIVSSRKAFYRISIWTRGASREEVENVGRHFKYGVLGFSPGKQMGGKGLASDVEFGSHKESMRKGKGGSTFTV